jgi:hypothetical protein
VHVGPAGWCGTGAGKHPCVSVTFGEMERGGDTGDVAGMKTICAVFRREILCCLLTGGLLLLKMSRWLCIDLRTGVCFACMQQYARHGDVEWSKAVAAAEMKSGSRSYRYCYSLEPGTYRLDLCLWIPLPQIDSSFRFTFRRSPGCLASVIDLRQLVALVLRAHQNAKDGGSRNKVRPPLYYFFNFSGHAL